MNAPRRRPKRGSPLPKAISRRTFAAVLLAALFSACTFNYDITEDAEDEPDIIMKDLEYVRMRNAHPQVRFRAEEARQYEKKHSMEMDAFSFDQYNAVPPGTEQLPDINVQGKGAFAKIQTDTGNVSITDAFIDVISEDMTITTQNLNWRNEERLLMAPEKVELVKSDGTKISGWNFTADIRRRGWQFEKDVEGDIIDTADETAPEEAAAEELLEAAESIH